MNLYRTLDEKVASFHNAIAENYQSATGKPQFTLMEKTAALGCGIYTLGGVEAIVSSLMTGYMKGIQILSGLALIGIGYIINYRSIRDCAQILEEHQANGKREEEAAYIKNRFQKYRFPLLLGGAALASLSGVLYFAVSPSHDGFYDYLKMALSFQNAALGTGAILSGSALYLADAKKLSEGKQTLFQRVRNFFKKK